MTRAIAVVIALVAGPVGCRAERPAAPPASSDGDPAVRAWLAGVREAIRAVDLAPCHPLPPDAAGACVCQRLCALALAPPPPSVHRATWSGGISLDVATTGAVTACAVDAASAPCPSPR